MKNNFSAKEYVDSLIGYDDFLQSNKVYAITFCERMKKDIAQAYAVIYFRENFFNKFGDFVPIEIDEYALYLFRHHPSFIEDVNGNYAFLGYYFKQ